MRIAPAAHLMICCLLLSLGLSALPASADSAKDFLGVPGPVRFQDTQFDLAWGANPSAGYFKQEYVPAGQKVERFTEMFIIEASNAAKPKGAASAKIASLEERKASDPFVNYAVISNNATGEIILDFILSDDSGDDLIVEWNAYRYAPLNKEGGVTLYAISRRSYGDDVDAFLADLKESRPRAIEALAIFEAPALKLP
jgi:hypothetical protein